MRDREREMSLTELNERYCISLCAYNIAYNTRMSVSLSLSSRCRSVCMCEYVGVLYDNNKMTNLQRARKTIYRMDFVRPANANKFRMYYSK